MERLGPDDAWFLYMENPTVQMHVTGVLVLDPSTAGDDFGFETVRRHYEERVSLIPAMHHRLVEVPFGLDHPIWVEDRDFAIEHHFRHDRVSGSESALADYLGGFVAEPLDRSRPLWEAAFVDGLDDGRAAVAIKMHHCTVDGISGLDVLAHLLDGAPVAAAPRPSPGPDPAPLSVMVDAAVNRMRSPLRPLRSMTRAAASFTGAGRTAVGHWLQGGGEVAHPLNAPRTSFNASVSAQRSVSLERVSLTDLKKIRHAFGTTVNDVVLAACAHGLRRYLLDRDELPGRPLVCSVPVSTHQSTTGGPANQVSDMFVNLPVEVEDPIERLARIHTGAEGAKEVQAAIGAHMLGDVVDLIPPAVFRFAGGLYSRAGLADRLPPVHNLIISNVPGSREPLFLAGAELVAIYPLGPLVEGTGLNITALSHLDDMDISLMACPELVPDAHDLASGIVEGVDVLLAAAAS